MAEIVGSIAAASVLMQAALEILSLLEPLRNSKDAARSDAYIDLLRCGRDLEDLDGNLHWIETEVASIHGIRDYFLKTSKDLKPVVGLHRRLLRKEPFDTEDAGHPCSYNRFFTELSRRLERRHIRRNIRFNLRQKLIRLNQSLSHAPDSFRLGSLQELASNFDNVWYLGQNAIDKLFHDSQPDTFETISLVLIADCLRTEGTIDNSHMSCTEHDFIRDLGRWRQMIEVSEPADLYMFDRFVELGWGKPLVHNRPLFEPTRNIRHLQDLMANIIQAMNIPHQSDDPIPIPVPHNLMEDDRTDMAGSSPLDSSWPVQSISSVDSKSANIHTHNHIAVHKTVSLLMGTAIMGLVFAYHIVWRNPNMSVLDLDQILPEEYRNQNLGWAATVARNCFIIGALLCLPQTTIRDLGLDNGAPSYSDVMDPPSENSTEPIPSPSLSIPHSCPRSPLTVSQSWDYGLEENANESTVQTKTKSPQDHSSRSRRVRPKIPCKYCHRPYPSNNLKNHFGSCPSAPESERMRFKCESCGKRSATKYNHDDHEKRCRNSIAKKGKPLSRRRQQ